MKPNKYYYILGPKYWYKIPLISSSSAYLVGNGNSLETSWLCFNKKNFFCFRRLKQRIVPKYVIHKPVKNKSGIKDCRWKKLVDLWLKNCRLVYCNNVSDFGFNCINVWKNVAILFEISWVHRVSIWFHSHL